ncbi:hypothetical protein [Nocardioides sp. NPDC006273]|uniref:hypothetical protein n=1 Tax=Nocardioides sp. NPDC006273 TaxID=3155598 RepID=UPI0033A650DC
MILLLTGLGVIALGALWFLQGSELVHIQPVLCAADCEPVVGHQPVWQLAGVVAILTGALASLAALRKLRR